MSKNHVWVVEVFFGHWMPTEVYEQRSGARFQARWRRAAVGQVVRVVKYVKGAK